MTEKIEIKKVEEIILKHKDCRQPHQCTYKYSSNYYLSCLVLILAEIKGKDPVEYAKEMGFVK